MRTRIRAAAVLFVAGFGVLLACSSPSTATGVPDAPDANVAVGVDSSVDSSVDSAVAVSKDAGTRFCRQTLGATFTAMEACCSPDERATDEYKATMGSAGAIQKGCGTSLDGSLAGARVGYDSVAADACIKVFEAALGTGVCRRARFATFELMKQPPCTNAIVGKQGKGSHCTVRYECEEGLTCVATAPGADAGTCEVPPAVGRPCGAPENDVLDLRFGEHRKCAPGSHCDFGTSLCTAPTTGECDFDADCSDGKLCIGEKCSPRGKLGNACESPAQCEPELFCDIVSGTSAGSCAAKKPAGAACASGFSECKGTCASSDAGSSCQAFCGSE